MSADINNQTTLITSQELKSLRYGISKDFDPLRLDPYVIAASERLRAWVGEDVYDDALDQADISALTSAQQKRILARREILKAAEGDLAMSYLTLNLNTFVSPDGQLAEAQAEGQTVQRFFNPDQVAKTAKAWLDQAYLLATPYLLSGDVPASAVELQMIELCLTE